MRQIALPLTQESARALTDAGYMPVSEYIALCKHNGWKAEDMTQPDDTQTLAATERLLPDLNDLPEGLRVSMCETGEFYSDVYGGQAALDIYNHLRDNLPAQDFPLFKRDSLLSRLAELEASNARLRATLGDLVFQIALTAFKYQSERDALQVVVDRARSALQGE